MSNPYAEREMREKIRTTHRPSRKFQVHPVADVFRPENKKEAKN